MSIKKSFVFFLLACAQTTSQKCIRPCKPSDTLSGGQSQHSTCYSRLRVTARVSVCRHCGPTAPGSRRTGTLYGSAAEIVGYALTHLVTRRLRWLTCWTPVIHHCSLHLGILPEFSLEKTSFGVPLRNASPDKASHPPACLRIALPHISIKKPWVALQAPCAATSSSVLLCPA